MAKMVVRIPSMLMFRAEKARELVRSEFVEVDSIRELAKRLD